MPLLTGSMFDVLHVLLNMDTCIRTNHPKGIVWEDKCSILPMFRTVLDSRSLFLDIMVRNPFAKAGGGGGAAEKLHQLKGVAHLETNLELLGCGFELALPGCRPNLDSCANSSTKLGSAGLLARLGQLRRAKSSTKPGAAGPPRWLGKFQIPPLQGLLDSVSNI